MKRVAILGGGAWGTALALTVKRAGNSPCIWSCNLAIRKALGQSKNHPAFSPEMTFDYKINASDDLHTVLDPAEAVFLAIPTQSLRAVLKQIPASLPKKPFMLCAKGIELSTGKTPSEIFNEFLPDFPYGVLSGPNFADEIAINLPAATVLAGQEDSFLHLMGDLLAHASFRPYFSHDIVGVEAASAIKNVLAIAAGIVEGKKLGNNAQAGLITRGLVEMKRFGTLRGGNPQTFNGLSGVGDLILSCKSPLSRNMKLGLRLGKAEKNKDHIIKEQIEGKNALSEGLWTAKALHQMALPISLPICNAVYDVLYTPKTVDTTITELLTRPVTYEN